MTVTFKVYKKSSANGRLTLYLGRRDFVDHVTGSDPVDGVINIDKEFINDKVISAQLLCSFRYGREDDETLGLSFKKELILDEQQLFPPGRESPPTRLQERLLSKLGKHAFPFHLSFPHNSPTSVTLQPSEEEAGEPCGVEYFIRAVMIDSKDGVEADRTGVNMAIRKIQFAPTRQGRQPSTTVRKDFMFSQGEMELESTLDRQLYYHGDDIRCSFVIRNTSNKTVKKIQVSVVQNIDIAMFTGGHVTAKVMTIESTEGCPIAPGSSLSKEIILSPTAKGHVRVGVALDGRLKGDDTSLASSTLLADENNKDIFGLVISYSVRVKLFLGAIGGDLTAELPFVLMHPRPNLHKLIKADTVGAVLSSIDDPEQDENIIFPSSAENNFEMKNLLTHRATKKTE